MQNLLDLAKQTIKIEIESLQHGINNLNESFEKIIENINNLNSAGKVVVMGMGKSGHIGKKIAATLASTGTPAFFVHPGEAGHGDLGMVSSKDIVIAISQSGKSEEIIKVIPYFKRFGIKIICMSGDETSPIAQCSDYFVNTSVLREACPLGLAPTSSTTLTLALGDAIAVCLLFSKGFTSDDFAITHPNGSLGKKLLSKIEDVMSTLNNTPYIKKDTTIKDAIYTISEKGLGFVVVVDEDLFPIGIFTDGDLRRLLNNEININTVFMHDVMIKKFKTISEKKLSVEAVKVMSEYKISMLPVVSENGKLVGAINIRQLVQAGVI